MAAASEAQRAARLFECYVRRAWPLHRLLVKHKLSRRCERCAASEKMAPLGRDGICQLCREAPASGTLAAPERNPADAAELDRLLREHQGAGRGRYDALVAYSGGKDSTYLVRRIRAEFPGLRVLAFTLDNGFMSPVAVQNVQELIPRLGVDHVFIRPRRDFYVRLFRYGLTHLNVGGGYGTVDFSDGEFMLDTARRLAAEARIPLILCGYSRYQVQNGLRLKAFESPRAQELADRMDAAGLPLAAIFSGEDLSRWWRGSAWPPEAVARLIFPHYAWDLEEEELQRQVAAWGLRAGANQSPIVTNHQLIPLLGVVDVHQRGYSSFEAEFCRMVREGKARRRDWLHVFELLEHCARTGLFVKETVQQSLAQLDLTPEDVGINWDQRAPASAGASTCEARGAAFRV